MMDYIVLVKQVPDIKNIPEDAWDWEKGTLRRGLLDNVLNDLDKQALAFALAMRSRQDGQIVSLTMGPSFADEVLRWSLAAGANSGVLLTDRKMGGADTAATAYPLARAVLKIEKELFGGSRNYVIISGMQSIDGDTAQVPPQIAEELEIPHIAYATAFNYQNATFQIRRITRGGAQTVTPLSYPCVVTVTKWTEPPNATFNRTRWARSQKLYEWGAADVSAEDKRIGLSGSRTSVYRIFSPREAGQRKCVFENDINKLLSLIKERFTQKSNETEKTDEQQSYRLPGDKAPTYHGEIWAFAEQENGEINPATLELLGKASELAGQLDVKTAAVLVGKNIAGMAPMLFAHGADKVYVVEHEHLADFLPVPYTMATVELIGRYHPQIMLFSATPLGRELAPRIAYRSGSGLTADCTGLAIFDYKKGEREQTAILQQTRPALGGNIMASIITQNSAVQMSTVRPGVFKARNTEKPNAEEIIRFKPQINAEDSGVRIDATEIKPPAAEMAGATVIVAGGGGCKTREGFERCIPSLAEHLGKFLGVPAVVGASRVAVEAGFIDRSHQVGQTGQTVRPRLYVAAGISGAVQHLSGMQNSDVIVGINKDPNARIFTVADIGITGSMEDIIPQMIEAIEAQGA